jgi:ribosomal-protein-alanine N-acetyltransferase
VGGATIETPRLLVRPFREDDLDAFAAIMGDPVTLRLWPRTFTRDEVAGWIARAVEACRAPGFGRRALELKDTGELIGDTGILRLELMGSERNDLGWILAERFQGRGLATEAAAALRDHAFASGLGAVWANMATDHTASRRVAEKIGMTLVATFRNARNRNMETCLYGQRADGQRPVP